MRVTALLRTVGVPENPRRALPYSSSEGGGCLEFFDRATESINLFFAKIPCKQVWNFLNLCKNACNLQGFFCFKSDATDKSLVAINHADFMTWILCRLLDLRGSFWSTGGRKWGTNRSRH